MPLLEPLVVSSGERQEACDSKYSRSKSEGSGVEDPEFIPKTVAFMLASGLLDQFASYTKTLSPLE
jgi:hypothetical protein